MAKMAYKDFVRQQMAKMKGMSLTPKAKMQKIALAWAQYKGNSGNSFTHRPNPGAPRGGAIYEPAAPVQDDSVVHDNQTMSDYGAIQGRKFPKGGDVMSREKPLDVPRVSGAIGGKVRRLAPDDHNSVVEALKLAYMPDGKAKKVKRLSKKRIRELKKQMRTIPSGGSMADHAAAMIPLLFG